MAPMEIHTTNFINYSLQPTGFVSMTRDNCITGTDKRQNKHMDMSSQ